MKSKLNDRTTMNCSLCHGNHGDYTNGKMSLHHRNNDIKPSQYIIHPMVRNEEWTAVIRIEFFPAIK